MSENETVEEGEVLPREEEPSTAVVPAATVEPIYAGGPAMSPADVFRLRKEIEGLIDEHFEEGRDYGTIPGTKKPCLLKPGAEFALSVWSYGLVFLPERQKSTNDWERGFLDYSYVAQVIDRRTGKPVAECEGSANSSEKRYANARKERVYDDGNVKSGALLADQKNTIQKVAQKRAAVGATVLACGLSGQFDHDLDELPAEARGGFQRGKSGPKGAQKTNGGGGGGGGKDPLSFVPSWGQYSPEKYGSRITWGDVVKLDPDYVAYILGENDKGEVIVKNKRVADALEKALAEARGGAQGPVPGGPTAEGRPTFATDAQLETLVGLLDSRRVPDGATKWAGAVIRGETRPRYDAMEEAILKLGGCPMKNEPEEPGEAGRIPWQ